MAALKRQLESETLLRVDLENKNKTLREELQFNAQVHETVNNLYKLNLQKKKSIIIFSRLSMKFVDNELMMLNRTMVVYFNNTMIVY